jgi:hypothetical protein
MRLPIHSNLFKTKLFKTKLFSSERNEAVMIKSQFPTWRFMSLVSCIALSWGLIGCGGAAPGVDPSLVSVTGKVSLDGKPLKAGNLSFVSSDTPGVGFGSNIDASGNYALVQSVSAKGAVPGNYKIRVECLDGVAAMGEGGVVTKAKSLIPEKYNSPDTSGLTATVEKGKPLVKNVDLKSM